MLRTSQETAAGLVRQTKRNSGKLADMAPGYPCRMARYHPVKW
jgi:hypothetical protein